MSVYVEFGSRDVSTVALLISFNRASGLFGGAKPGVDIEHSPGTGVYGATKSRHFDIPYGRFKELFAEAQQNNTILDMTDEALARQGPKGLAP